jgi:peptidoglycan/xylan/chitin deacetylase (PgdA/CDA1 family)
MNRLNPIAGFGLRGAHALLSGKGAAGSLLILILHRVLERHDPLQPDEPDAAQFAAQMDLIAGLCTVLPLSEAVERLYAGTLPARAACITFDDGYLNNLTVAAPILRARGLPATVFVSTGYIGNGRMFNDTVIESVRRAGAELDLSDLGLGRYTFADDRARLRAIDQILSNVKYMEFSERLEKAAAMAQRVGGGLPEDLMMSEPQIRELHGKGIEIGAHTITHPILCRVDAQTARREIGASREILQGITGSSVSMFAYPNGRPYDDYDGTHVEMVRACGFAAAVSTAWGAATSRSNRYQLPRLMPWDKTALRFAARLLRARRELSAPTVPVPAV